MLGLGNPIHVAFVLVLLLLVFGAKRLPEMGKSIGEGLRGFKDSISEDASTRHLSEAHTPVGIDETPAASTQPTVVPVSEPAVAPVAQPVAARTPMRPVA